MIDSNDSILLKDICKLLTDYLPEMKNNITFVQVRLYGTYVTYV